jgi:hypothetical protein
MKTVAALGLLAVSIMLLPASDVAAQKGTWITGIYLGYSASAEENAPTGDVAGYFFAQNFVHPVISVGGEIGILRLGNEKVSDTVLGDAELGTHVFELTADVRATGKGKLRPYGNVGAGAYWVTVNGTGAQGLVGATGTDTRFGANLGGGLIIGPATKKWSFGLDGRWHSIVEGDRDGSTLNLYAIMIGFNVRE